MPNSPVSFIERNQATGTKWRATALTPCWCADVDFGFVFVCQLGEEGSEFFPSHVETNINRLVKVAASLYLAAHKSGLKPSQFKSEQGSDTPWHKQSVLSVDNANIL